MPIKQMNSHLAKQAARLMFVALSTITSAAGLAGTVEVADGDSDALRAAIVQAGQSGEPTVIRLAPDGTYPLSASAGGPVVLAGEVVLDGNGATIVAGEDDSRLAAMRVAPNGVYRIMDLAWHGDFRAQPHWLDNRGTLALEHVSFSGHLFPAQHDGGGTVGGFPIAGTYRGSLIGSTGAASDLTLRNVTIDLEQPMAGGAHYPDALADTVARAVTVASGHASLDQVTVSLRLVKVSEHTQGAHIAALRLTGSQGPDNGPTRVRVSNSVFRLQGPELPNVQLAPCDSGFESEVTSLGGNVTNVAGTCGFQKVVDRIGLGAYGDHGGPVPTLALEPSSAAVGFGDSVRCQTTDARGYVRDPACDSGAFEYGAAPRYSIAAEALGGYWSSPHKAAWLAVSYPLPNTALLVWSTFDDQGNAVTVYGVGRYDDGSIVVTQAAVDRPVPGSDPVVLKPELWGHLRLDLESKFDAVLHYDSVQPGFADGSRTLDRLTISYPRNRN